MWPHARSQARPCTPSSARSSCCARSSARERWLHGAFEVVGRRAAGRILSRLRLDLVERRLRSDPSSADGTDSSELATLSVTGIDALETIFARYLPQVVLAFLVPLAVLVLVAAIDLTSAAVMLLTLPLVPVFMWLIGRYTAASSARALAGPRAPGRPLRRRRPRAPDSSRLQPGPSAGGADRARQRPVPRGDDGDAAPRLSLRHGARARRDDRSRPRRSHRRRAAGRRWAGLAGRPDGARARAGALPPDPQRRGAVPRQRRRCGGGGKAARPRRGTGRRRRAAPRPRPGPADGNDPARAGVVHLSRPRVSGTRGGRPRARRRRVRRARRPERRRKEHPGITPPAPRDTGGRPPARRRCRPRSVRPAGVAEPACLVAAAADASADDRRREHPTRRSRRHRRPALCGGGARRRGSVRPRPAGRLRDRRRRRRTAAFARPDPADRDWPARSCGTPRC